MGNCIRSSVVDQSKPSREILTSSPGGDGDDKKLSSETTKSLSVKDPSGLMAEEAKSICQNDAGGVMSEESRDNYAKDPVGAISEESKDIYDHDLNGEAMSEELKRLHEKKDVDGEIFDEPNLTAFTLAELTTATKNFDPDSLLGEGGSGTVYRGWIQENSIEGDKEWIDKNSVAAFSDGSKMVVAIKKLNSRCLRGSEEWKSEVNFLGRLSHSNLVKLLGYCREGNEQLLVYEYMPKGSLENHLFKRKNAAEVLTWERRIHIALDAARGLSFLRSLDKQVIFRDFKTSNILLDVNYNAKVLEFCLPAAGVGISGENAASDKTSTEGNVYRFGAMLLELLAGKRLVDTTRPNEQQDLVEWARTHLSNKEDVKTIMDQRLNGQYLFKAASEAAHLILKCLELDPKSRPSMQQIIESLQQIAAMKKKKLIGKRVRPRSPAATNYINTKQPSPRQSPHHPRYTAKLENGSPSSSLTGRRAKVMRTVK